MKLCPEYDRGWEGQWNKRDTQNQHTEITTNNGAKNSMPFD